MVRILFCVAVYSLILQIVNISMILWKPYRRLSITWFIIFKRNHLPFYISKVTGHIHTSLVSNMCIIKLVCSRMSVLTQWSWRLDCKAYAVTNFHIAIILWSNAFTYIGIMIITYSISILFTDLVSSITVNDNFLVFICKTSIVLVFLPLDSKYVYLTAY